MCTLIMIITVICRQPKKVFFIVGSFIGILHNHIFYFGSLKLTVLI